MGEVMDASASGVPDGTLNVSELRKVRLDKGEVLIIKQPHPWPMEAVEALRSAFPDNKVLVLDDGAEIQVIRP